MTFPVDTGVPTHAGTMIPEIWAPKMLTKFYASSVFGEIANTDYEGSIRSMGDTVHIRTTPDITISNYVKGQQLTHQQPEPANVDLLIDTGKYWSFIAQRVDLAQADYDFVNDWTQDAAEQMKIVVDTDILANIYGDAAAANSGATAGAISGNINLGTTGAAVQITKTTVLDYIVDMGTVLDEQNIPETGRWLVIPAWMAAMIKKSDLKDASLAGDGTSIMRNGRIGMIDRFTIYSSNNVATSSDTGTKYNLVAGHKSGLTFASQLLENEGPLKHPDYFGEWYRGLQVYGYKVTKPDAIVHGYVYK